MRIKLLVSAGAVIALSTISIIAYAKTPVVKEIPVMEFQTIDIPLSYPSKKATNGPEITVKVSELIEDRKPLIELNKEEKYLLAKLAMSEAGNQDIEGKAYVMMVVINRVMSEEFPETVMFQQNKCWHMDSGRPSATSVSYFRRLHIIFSYSFPPMRLCRSFLRFFLMVS